MSHDSITDKDLLSRLLESPKLREDEREAFGDMYDRLDNKRIKNLSHRQRQWCETVYERMDLAGEESCANLFSRGVGLPKKPLGKFAFEMLPLPDKPPGR